MDIMVAAFERCNEAKRFEFVERIAGSDHQRKCRIKCKTCKAVFDSWAVNEIRKGKQSRIICPECGAASDGNVVFVKSEKAKKAVDLYRLGLMQTEIAEMLGCTVSDVGNSAKYYGVVEPERRQRGSDVANGRKKEQSFQIAIKRLADADLELLDKWDGAHKTYRIKNNNSGEIFIRSGSWIIGDSQSCRRRSNRIAAVSEKGITILKLIERDGPICYMCGKETTFSDRRWGNYGPDYPTIDHIIPLSKGGGNIWSNVKVCCGECNCKKGDRMEVRA